MKKRSIFAVLRRRGFKRGLEYLYYKFLVELFCLIENVCGAAVVPWLMAPLAGLDMLKRKRDFPQFVRLRSALPDEFWQGVPPQQHYRKIIRDWHEGLGTMLFYHRLSRPYWQKRFQITGSPPHTLPEWGKRPMIMAFLHTGQFGLIRFWLRAQGISAASLIGGLPHFADLHVNILNIGDIRYGLQGVPQTFYTTRSLRDAIRFLTPGHVLTVAMDGDGTSLNQHSAGEFPIQVKEGACRIAAQTNSLVIPTSVRRTAPCRYELRFGQPVPDELIQKEDFCAATQYLISELWNDLKKDPQELNWTTLEALAPTLKAKRTWWP
jgi:lauroyl/myristoyl acyltransferase